MGCRQSQVSTDLLRLARSHSGRLALAPRACPPCNSTAAGSAGSCSHGPSASSRSPGLVTLVTSATTSADQLTRQPAARAAQAKHAAPAASNMRSADPSRSAAAAACSAVQDAPGIVPPRNTQVTDGSYGSHSTQDHRSSTFILEVSVCCFGTTHTCAAAIKT